MYTIDLCSIPFSLWKIGKAKAKGKLFGFRRYGKEEEFYLYNVFHLLKSKYLTADYRPTSRDVGVSQYNTTLILFVWKT